MRPRALLYVDGHLAGPAEYPVSALAGGTAAVFATRVRFYQQLGYDATVALSSGAIMTSASWTAITVLFLVSPPFARGSIRFEITPESGGDAKPVWIILALVVVVAVVAGLALAVPRLCRRAADSCAPRCATSGATWSR